MGLKTSFFNTTVLRKDLTRFAPAWGIFTAGCLLVIPNVVDANDPGGMLVKSLSLMGFVNFCYALVCALLLFGDLFNARLCNALHAMPLRREGWFLTHLAAGVCFALIPYGVTAVCILPMLDWNWVMAPVWLLGSMLEYLFFFSAAVLCVFCTGSRFAGVVIYGIINFFVLIVQWLLDTIYMPLLYGVVSDMELLVVFCPVVNMLKFQGDGYFRFEWVSDGVSSHSALRFIGFSDDFPYLVIIMAIGIAFGAVALMMYRRRRLESAGDFMAVDFLKPVFAVIYTLCVGAVFAFLGEAMDAFLAFLIVGLLLGWFTAQMLLQRTVRVLHKKTLRGLLAFALAMVLSMGITWLDPVGISRYVPKAEEVKAVNVSWAGYMEPNDAQLEKVLQLHEAILTDGRKPSQNTISVDIQYTLTDGSHVERSYTVGRDIPSIMNPLKELATMPETVLGYGEYPDWETFKKRIPTVVIYGENGDTIYGDKAAALLEAIKADCEQGTMGQSWVVNDGSYHHCYDLQLIYRDGSYGNSIIVYSNAVNTVRWIKENMPQGK